MVVRMPSNPDRPGADETALDVLGHEILAEKAASLGRAGQRVEEALARLRAHEDDAELRPALLKEAAEAVHAYFIQRELCGLRKHDAVIRDYDIPQGGAGEARRAVAAGRVSAGVAYRGFPRVEGDNPPVSHGIPSGRLPVPATICPWP